MGIQGFYMGYLVIRSCGGENFINAISNIPVNIIFLTAIWLFHRQIWAILEGAASLS